MRQFPSYLVVVRLLILLKTATITVSYEPDYFSIKLEQVVNNILGVKQFEVTKRTVVRINVASVSNTAFIPDTCSPDTSCIHFNHLYPLS